MQLARLLAVVLISEQEQLDCCPPQACRCSRFHRKSHQFPSPSRLIRLSLHPRAQPMSHCFLLLQMLQSPQILEMLTWIDSWSEKPRVRE
jgi:hypothetical protein